MSTLRLILGDQLTSNISSLSDVDKKNDIILMAEVMEEATYVQHHKKKIIFIFSAMRHFAQSLSKKGFNVLYKKLDDKNNKGSLFEEVKYTLSAHKNIDSISITEPGEYRLLSEMQTWSKKLKKEVDILPDTRFIFTHDEFSQWAEGRKELIMEYFYRDARKKTQLLLKDNKPEGNKWNFDKSNRKPPKKGLHIPPLKTFKPDNITEEVIQLVEKKFPSHFGDATPFNFAVTEKDATLALKHFCEYALPYFGDYQDAMLSNQPFLFHSILSPYINAGLLDPLEVCKMAEKAYHEKHAPINAVEGFIRQIIGWREYIRGIYWLHMPKYVNLNTLKAKKKLPDFYWTADTDMNCLQQVITMTKEEAYSHHIQRLMVTGNFATLAGLSVHDVHEWYLAVYADAYEWVELPNTLGMALHADGGIVGTKPYIASGAYINRMSDFCQHCNYNVKEKTGEEACPFNYLYWDFLDRHKQHFIDNRRMTLAYNNLNKLPKETLTAIRESATLFLKHLT